MKPLIIVDFSHLFSRNLFVAINQAKPRIKKGKYLTEDIKPYFLHLLFNSLQYNKNKFKGEMVLAFDSKGNWRKDFYKDYKGTRAKGKETTEIDWDGIHQIIEEVKTTIEENFPFKVLKIPKAEADDIGGVLSKKFGNERKVVLITSDHDWLQNISHGKYVEMYDPIKMEYSDLTPEENEIIQTPAGEMSKFTAIHTLIGDSGDNVPNITFETKFSDNFLAFLKENEIMSDSVKEVRNMSIYDELLKKYEVLATVKSGKRKGLPMFDYRVYYRLKSGELLLKDEYLARNLDEEYEVEEQFQKDVFKKVPFGIKKAEKAVQDVHELQKLITSHPMYKDNFMFSNTLVDFDKIPDYLSETILQEYKNTTVNYNPNGILEYFVAEGLGKQVNQITKFYCTSYIQKSTTSLDDFF